MINNKKLMVFTNQEANIMKGCCKIWVTKHINNVYLFFKLNCKNKGSCQVKMLM